MIFQDLLGYSTLRTAEFEETNRKSLVNGSFTRLFRCSRRMPDSSSAKFRMPEANAIGPGKRTKRRLRASIPANRIRRPVPAYSTRRTKQASLTLGPSPAVQSLIRNAFDPKWLKSYVETLMSHEEVPFDCRLHQ